MGLAATINGYETSVEGTRYLTTAVELDCKFTAVNRSTDVVTTDASHGASRSAIDIDHDAAYCRSLTCESAETRIGGREKRIGVICRVEIHQTAALLPRRQSEVGGSRSERRFDLCRRPIRMGLEKNSRGTRYVGRCHRSTVKQLPTGAGKHR